MYIYVYIYIDIYVYNIYICIYSICRNEEGPSTVKDRAKHNTANNSFPQNFITEILLEVR